MSPKDENITCQQAEQWLVDFLYGELDPAAQRLFQLHLEACPQHRQEVASLRQVLELVRNQSEEAPEALSARIRNLARSRLQEERNRGLAWQIVFSPWTAALAASLGVIVLAVALWPVVLKRENAAPEPTASPIAVTTTVELAASAPARTDKNLEAVVADEKTRSGEDNLRQEAKDEVLSTGEAEGKATVAGPKERKAPAKKQTVITKFAQPSPSASQEPALGGKLVPDDTAGWYTPPQGQQRVASATQKPSHKQPESPPGMKAPVGETPPPPPAEQKPKARASAYTPDALTKEQAPAAIPEKTVRADTDFEADEQEQKQAPVAAEPESEPRKARAKKGASAVGDDTEVAQAAYVRARNFMEAGDCTRQIEEAQKALALAPRHRLAPQTLLDQASCLVKLQRFEEARESYRRLERDFPAYQNEARAGLRRLEGK